MENKTMTTKEVAKEITHRIQESIKEQDDPKNRIVSGIWVETIDIIFKCVCISSDCDGFAEERKVVLKTCNPSITTDYFKSSQWTMFNAGIGDTEEEVVSDIRSSFFSSKNEAEWAGLRILNDDDPTGTMSDMLEKYIRRVIKNSGRDASVYTGFEFRIGELNVRIEQFLNNDDFLNAVISSSRGNSEQNFLIDLTK